MPFAPIDPSTAELAPVTTAGDPVVDFGQPFVDMKAEITQDLSNRGDISTRVGGWVNRAYNNLAAMLTINELIASMSFPLLSGQPFYLLPNAVAWINWFGDEDSTDYLDGGRGFEMIDMDNYRRLPDSTSELTQAILPYKYVRQGRLLALWPTPAADFDGALDFRVRVQPLINDQDCTLLPPEFDQVIVDMAEGIALRKLGFRSEGDRTYNDAISALRPIQDTDANERDQMFMALRPVRTRAELYRSRR